MRPGPLSQHFIALNQPVRASGSRRLVPSREAGVQGSRPVSYRSFKHLLGETSLERKCRFIFGLGILLLVTVSFFLYGKKTEEPGAQADDPDRPDARQRRPQGTPFIKPLDDKDYRVDTSTHLWGEFKPQDDHADLQGPGAQSRTARTIRTNSQPTTSNAERSLASSRTPLRRKSGSSGDKAPPMSAKQYIDVKMSDGKIEKQFQYIQAVVFESRPA